MREREGEKGAGGGICQIGIIQMKKGGGEEEEEEGADDNSPDRIAVAKQF